MSDEPIVIWGPGSEWFWIMLQTVVVAVTLVGIYFQFRLQRAANAFDQLGRIDQQWDSEQMLRARLDVLRSVAAGEQSPEGALTLVGNFWETVASLVRQGHVNARSVSETYGGAAAMWWSAIAGATRSLRKDRLDPTIFANFEWLAKRFSADGVKAGAPREYDGDTLRQIFEAAIPGMEDRIRQAEDLRMAPEHRAPRPRLRQATGAARPRSPDRR
ncbi:MAG TPA: hypothetical protein VFI15_11045 [Candidatus Limnocylindrales bacterium]|nr:hypothetical protein [Candidatus Limnocylindrales bacterium]